MPNLSIASSELLPTPIKGQVRRRCFAHRSKVNDACAICQSHRRSVVFVAADSLGGAMRFTVGIATKHKTSAHLAGAAIAQWLLQWPLSGKLTYNDSYQAN